MDACGLLRVGMRKALTEYLISNLFGAVSFGDGSVVFSSVPSLRLRSGRRCARVPARFGRGLRAVLSSVAARLPDGVPRPSGSDVGCRLSVGFPAWAPLRPSLCAGSGPLRGGACGPFCRRLPPGRPMASRGLPVRSGQSPLPYGDSVSAASFPKVVPGPRVCSAAAVAQGRGNGLIFPALDDCL